MAASLQERLNYLVNYSSQLIFVGGDTQLSQAKALESFLFQQGEDTEIAYIASEPESDINEFRKQLCQQLLGQSSHFYHRPLNECLASLNTFSGPVMIAITRAELLPKQLLQELWELVLQSRFAGNKQHLNVVLFANKHWAKEAKSWLPDNDSGTPLLLSTQQATQYKGLPDVSFDEENPSLAAFEYTDGPTEQNIEQRPLIKMGAFWAAALLLLISVIIGSSVWQKGSRVSALFTPLNDDNSSSETIHIPQSTKTTVTNWKQKDSVKDKAPAANNVSTENLVTALTTNNVENQTSQPEPKTTIPKSTQLQPKEPLEPNKQHEKLIAVDNQVPSEGINIDKTNSGSFYQPDKFVVQFAAFQQKSRLAEYLRINNLSAISHSYSTQRNGKDLHILTHNVLFDSKTQAREAIISLPQFSNKNSVFIKSTNSIIKELSVVEPTDTLNFVN